MLKMEHIGIAVESLITSIPLFEKLFNTPCYKTEDVWSENVKTAFFKKGETKVELLQSLTNDGVVKKFLDKKGEGIHHIAFEVDNIYEEMQRLKKEFFELLNDKPKLGADNKLVCFLNPKNTNNILIELCQDNEPDSGISPQKIQPS
jgi:methylmalonyl-CoA/ethylmalonyl-CoA epimerase